jgi:putative transposase
MNKKCHTPEQIISKLREAEVLLSQGQSVPVAFKRIEVSEQNYYRWRKEWGRFRLDQAKRSKELERENSRLKRLEADQALDNPILKEVATGNFLARPRGAGCRACM